MQSDVTQKNKSLKKPIAKFESNRILSFTRMELFAQSCLAHVKFTIIRFKGTLPSLYPPLFPKCPEKPLTPP